MLLVLFDISVKKCLKIPIATWNAPIAVDISANGAIVETTGGKKKEAINAAAIDAARPICNPFKTNCILFNISIFFNNGSIVFWYSLSVLSSCFISA